MKDVPKYVVVIPQDDGSLYPLKFHSNYDEAVITANNHDKDSKVKAQIRSDGPEVWKQFEEKERQEKGGEIVLDGHENDEDARKVSLVSPETTVKLDNFRKPIGKLVEFADKLELRDIPITSFHRYQFVPDQEVKPCGLLFWGAPTTQLFNLEINGEEQLAITGPISVRAFLNPYISIEAVQYWVEKRAKLQYTNIALPSMKPGDKMEVIVDTPCVICACGMKYELVPGLKT